MLDFERRRKNMIGSKRNDMMPAASAFAGEGRVAVAKTGKYAASALKEGNVVIADAPNATFKEFMQVVAFALGADVITLKSCLVYVPGGTKTAVEGEDAGADTQAAE